MFSRDGVLTTTPSSKIALVEVSCRIPVLLPEDTLSSWQALKRCFATQTDLMFVRCPGPADDILKHCSRFMPCVLVIDEACVGRLELQRFVELINFGRSVSVLVKVPEDDFETVERLLRIGCMGFVTERSSSSVVAQAIRALSKGEIWASRRILSSVVRGLLASQSPQNLTSRENQILQLIGCGLSNNEIAEKLFISRETVRWHIRTLYAKIGVRERADAARYAHRLEQEPELAKKRPQRMAPGEKSSQRSQA